MNTKDELIINHRVMVRMSLPDRIITSLAGMLFMLMSLGSFLIPFAILYQAFGSTNFSWGVGVISLAAFSVCCYIFLVSTRYTLGAIKGYKEKQYNNIYNNIDEPYSFKDVALGILMLPIVLAGSLIAVLLAGLAIFTFVSWTFTLPAWLIFLGLWFLHEQSIKKS